MSNEVKKRKIDVENNAGRGNLEDVCDDCMYLIFEFLPMEQKIKRLNLICKDFYRMVRYGCKAVFKNGCDFCYKDLKESFDNTTARYRKLIRDDKKLRQVKNEKEWHEWIDEKYADYKTLRTYTKEKGFKRCLNDHLHSVYDKRNEAGLLEKKIDEHWKSIAECGLGIYNQPYFCEEDYITKARVRFVCKNCIERCNSCEKMKKVPSFGDEEYRRKCKLCKSEICEWCVLNSETCYNATGCEGKFPRWEIICDLYFCEKCLEKVRLKPEDYVCK